MDNNSIQRWEMEMTGDTLAPLHAYAKACRASTSFKHLRTAAFEFYDQTPVKMMSYIHYPPVGVEDFNTNLNVSSDGFPEEWRHIYYQRRLYECDPMARLASTRIYRLLTHRVYYLLTH